jgi:hypothetical protein
MTTIVYVTTGAWGTGTGAPNSAAQVDGNFYNLDQRMVDLVADFAEGKRIDHVTYSPNSMTFYYTDGTSQVIPLPVATLTLVGEWMNSKTYLRGDMVTFTPLGIFQVLQDHTTPPPPAPFDPNAVDGSGNLLYQIFMPLHDVNYDAAVFVPGSIQRDPDELLWQGVANRAMKLPLGNAGCYGYLGAGNDGTSATDIILSIEKNSTEIGTITFAAGGTIDAEGGQLGTFSIPADADFVAGDRYALRVTQSDNTEPSDLSVTLPFVRMDLL